MDERFCRAVRSEAASSVQFRTQIDHCANSATPETAKLQMNDAARAIRVALVGIANIDVGAHHKVWCFRARQMDMTLMAKNPTISSHVITKTALALALPFLTREWLDSIDAALTACAATLGWCTTTACIVLLSACGHQLLSLPFVARAMHLLRTEPPLPINPHSAIDNLTATEQHLVGCRFLLNVTYHKLSNPGVSNPRLALRGEWRAPERLDNDVVMVAKKKDRESTPPPLPPPPHLPPDRPPTPPPPLLAPNFDTNKARQNCFQSAYSRILSMLSASKISLDSADYAKQVISMAAGLHNLGLKS